MGGILGYDKTTQRTDTRTFIDSFGTNISNVDGRSYKNVGNVSLTFANGGAKLPTGNPVTDTIREFLPVAALILVGGIFLLKGKG